MKGVAQRTRTSNENNAFRNAQKKKAKEIIESKKKNLQFKKEFLQQHFAVNRYLTYRGDSVYIKKGALASLLKIARKKWGSDTL